MLNIIYLCSTLERTGPTNQLFNIISNLDKSIYKARVITLSPEPESSLFDKFIQNGIEVKSLSLNRLVTHHKLLKLLALEFEVYKPDIVHSQGIRSDHLMSLFDNTTKRVATLRNIPYLDYPMAYGKCIGKLMAFFHLKALNKIDQPVTVSYGVQNALMSKFKSELKVVRNGVDHNFFNPEIFSSNDSEMMRETLGIDKKTIVLVYTGILEERKQLDLLFDLVDEVPDVKLLVLGDGELNTKLSSHQAVTSGKILMCGSVPDVRKYLAVSDCFVSLSAAEGLPNSMLEAMMMGLPVLASDIDPHKEVIFDTNVPVRLFDILKPSLISDFLHNDLRGFIAESNNFNIREYTVEKFSAQSMSRGYQDIYIDLLS